jgi:hypothetical protein
MKPYRWLSRARALAGSGPCDRQAFQQAPLARSRELGPARGRGVASSIRTARASEARTSHRLDATASRACYYIAASQCRLGLSGRCFHALRLPLALIASVCKHPCWGRSGTRSNTMSVAAGQASYAWGRQLVHVADTKGPAGTVKQCLVCYTDVAADSFVRFGPCGHEVCSLCMHELRKDAIRKVRRCGVIASQTSRCRRRQGHSDALCFSPSAHHSFC